MKTLVVAVLAVTVLALTSPVPSEADPYAPDTAGAPAADRAGRRPSGPCALRTVTRNVSEGARTPYGYARSSGTVRAVTLFIDFPDARARITPKERYAEFFPAVADYFRRSSYGRLDYRSTPFLHWIRMAHPYRWYGITRGSAFDPNHDDGYHAISKEILAAVDDRVDFSRYDLINVLAAPNAGPPAVQDVRSVTFAGAATGLETYDGTPFRNVSFIWSRQTGDSPYRVLTHENAHSFGLPDLYTAAPSRAIRTPVGHWDPMDEDWGPSNDFLAWHKWKLGWLAPREVHCLDRPGTRTITLTPTSRRGGAKLAVIPLSPTHALTLEARAPGPLDHAVCRPGVLVTTVASDLPSGTGPVRASDATPGSAGCYTTDPNVNAPLSDAPYRAGQRCTAPGVMIDVLRQERDGSWRVRVRRQD
ncbi:M6 family metalloprotease domain-containing protein [Streptomyces morookaense]|uniref:M6 family metalloprotease domain-containing protein n=1 Tax=Streptomyces morookaense TaxID=1970 RepID=A0A7Y7B4T5_STRMO|nr:M6 family metalloprotease domain-containing protein [Streptomyces morookaense]NVK79043.1 M6 family metalloprotease domain-containing protein [Streptomyces morookaense]GHF09922.1 M6 family metalloprotease domain-containing protein [Streptomyces morookaense]